MRIEGYGRHVHWHGDPGSKITPIDDLIQKQFFKKQPWGQEWFGAQEVQTSVVFRGPSLFPAQEAREE